MDKNDKLTPAAEQEVDLATLGEITGTMTRPKSLSRDDLTGTEDIGADEVRLPRIGIAQGLSHEMTPGDTLYIEGLTLFDMFNDLTGEIYGKGPITFVPVKRDTKRIEFTPRNQGGGVVDLDVPKGDPRLQWTKSDPSLTKADTPPVATEFFECVVLLLRPGKAPEPIVLSIARKNKWNTQAVNKILTVAKLRTAPIYANLFSIDTHIPGKNDKGTFGVPTIRDLGFIPKDTPAGAALFTYAKQFHDSLEGKEIIVNREPGDEDDFPTDNES